MLLDREAIEIELAIEEMRQRERDLAAFVANWELPPFDPSWGREPTARHRPSRRISWLR